MGRFNPDRVLKSASLYRQALVVAIVALMAACLVACAEEEPVEEPTAVATATPTVAAEPTATPVPAADIRDVDFSEVAEVREVRERLEQSGGELVEEDIQYVDLTGDGREEAIVPLFSGGTAGNIALWVYGYVDDRLEMLLSQPDAYKISARVEDGTLVLVEPVYGPDDPNCCPSHIHNSYYEWDGSELALVHEETIDNPAGTP